MLGIGGRRISLEELHHHIDCLFELRVVASAHSLRVVFHIDIGRNAVILHVPRAIGIVESEVRPASEAAVQQVAWVGVMTNEAAPGALADQWTNACLPEHPGQGVAARAGHFVGDHGQELQTQKSR